MGDGAQYALEQWIHGGIQGAQMKRNPITRVQCEICDKEVHGRAALMRHNKAKHGVKTYTEQQIIRVQDDEWYGEGKTND